MTRLTADQMAGIIKDFRLSGLPLRAIAKRRGTCVGAVWRATQGMKRYVPRRLPTNCKLTLRQRRKLIDKYVPGVTIRDLARRYRVSPTTIHKHIVAADDALRAQP